MFRICNNTEFPMNRAVTRSGKDGAITNLRNRSATCSSVSKSTATRDIDAKTHMYHVPWEFGGTGLRVVQDRNGRYLRTDRCPSVREQSRGSQPRSRRTDRGPGAGRAPTSGPNTRTADRTGRRMPPHRHESRLSADPYIATVTPRRHTDREVVSDHGRTALGALPISAERLTSDDAHLVVHRIHGQRRQYQPDTPR